MKFPSVRVGVCEGAKCGEIFSPATCEVLFGARRWARALAGGLKRVVRRVGVGEGAAACGVVAMCSLVRVGVDGGSVA